MLKYIAVIAVGRSRPTLHKRTDHCSRVSRTGLCDRHGSTLGRAHPRRLGRVAQTQVTMLHIRPSSFL